jgi:hypothetical protein
MMMPSGSLVPGRDARMRATASAGDSAVDVKRSQSSQVHLRSVTQHIAAMAMLFCRSRRNPRDKPGGMTTTG